MGGRIETVERYSRAMLQSRPGDLFVFGDNMAFLGRGGQARECRGEPNAIGVVTKWRPSNDEDAFFCDADLDKVRWSIQASYRKLAEHIARGGVVVFPADGVGTGLADLQTRAPAISKFIERCNEHLRSFCA